MSVTIFAALFLLVTPSLAANATECDTPPPPGFTNHGDCNILCRNTEWHDLLTFYVANYLVHAATVNSQPGQSTVDTLYTSFLVLLFPVAGIFTAYESMGSLAVFAPTDLQRAARAGALYMVHQETSGGHWSGQGPVWRKVSTESRPGTLEKKTECSSIWEAKYHGLHQLPKGYTLVPVPKNATFKNDPEAKTEVWKLWLTLGLITLFQRSPRRMTLSYDYCFIKILVSIMQLFFASVTLYRAKGNQIQVYGYAAFGLTVIPYAWMSFLNLVGSALRPQYGSRFLVESKSLDDLKEEIGIQHREEDFVIEGTVGRIDDRTEDIISDASKGHTPLRILIGLIASCLGISIMVGLVPVLVMFWVFLQYGSPESKSDHQDIWIVLWLIFGFVGSFFLPLQRGHIWVLMAQALNSTALILKSMEPMLDTPPHRLPVFRRILQRCALALYNWLALNHGLIESSEKLHFLCRRDITTVISVLLPIFWALPAGMGFYVVGKMIMEYGVCTRFSK